MMKLESYTYISWCALVILMKHKRVFNSAGRNDNHILLMSATFLLTSNSLTSIVSDLVFFVDDKNTHSKWDISNSIYTVVLHAQCCALLQCMCRCLAYSREMALWNVLGTQARTRHKSLIKSYYLEQFNKCLFIMVTFIYLW